MRRHYDDHDGFSQNGTGDSGKHKPFRRLAGASCADFGFSLAEVYRCARCGISQRGAFSEGGFLLTGYSIPLSPQCPVAALVGVCKRCLEVVGPATFSGAPYYDHRNHCMRRWSPPPLTQPVSGEPVYVIVRRFCDDARLVAGVAAVWEGLPQSVRRALRRHLRPPESYSPSFARGALRVEALPSWPGRRNELAACLNAGHAIRLHSSTVDAMPHRLLETLIAHELAHCYQIAAGTDGSRHRRLVEKEAVAIMREWGYDDRRIDAWSSREIHRKFRAMWERRKEHRRREDEDELIKQAARGRPRRTGKDGRIP